MNTTQPFRGVEPPRQTVEFRLTAPRTAGLTVERVEQLVDAAAKRTAMRRDPVMHADSIYGRPAKPAATPPKTAGELLTERAAVVAKEQGISLAQAFCQVFDTDADLRARYVRERDARQFDDASAEAETMGIVQEMLLDPKRDAWEIELDDLAMAYEAKHNLEEGQGKMHILRQRPDLQEKLMAKLQTPNSDGTALTELNRHAALRAHLTGETFPVAFSAVLTTERDLAARYARER